MATGSILLPIGAAVLPDGSASNAAPAIYRRKSTAAAPTPYWLEAAFDASTTERLFWSFRLPADYASTPVMKVLWKMASATTGNVVMTTRVAALSDGEASTANALALANANVSAATAVPGTVGHIKAISISITNLPAGGFAAGDFVVVYLIRDSSDVNDTATGDLELVAASLEYTTV